MVMNETDTIVGVLSSSSGLFAPLMVVFSGIIVYFCLKVFYVIDREQGDSLGQLRELVVHFGLLSVVFVLFLSMFDSLQDVSVEVESKHYSIVESDVLRAEYYVENTGVFLNESEFGEEWLTSGWIDDG